MNRLVAVLAASVVALVGAVTFLLGRPSTEAPEPAAVDATRRTRPSMMLARPGQPPPLIPNPEPRAPRADRPVEVGGDAISDACGGVAKVVGLDPLGDNFLAVKAGPSLRARRVDKLGPGAQVHSCGEAGDGRWTAIVYEPGGGVSGRCGVTTPAAVGRDYRGPCLSGWVSSAYLETIAG